jgi:hypothetical protein
VAGNVLLNAHADAAEAAPGEAEWRPCRASAGAAQADLSPPHLRHSPRRRCADGLDWQAQR